MQADTSQASFVLLSSLLYGLLNRYPLYNVPQSFLQAFFIRVVQFFLSVGVGRRLPIYSVVFAVVAEAKKLHRLPRLKKESRTLWCGSPLIVI
jgi:hypothetical protein